MLPPDPADLAYTAFHRIVTGCRVGLDDPRHEQPARSIFKRVDEALRALGDSVTGSMIFRAHTAGAPPDRMGYALAVLAKRKSPVLKECLFLCSRHHSTVLWFLHACDELREGRRPWKMAKECAAQVLEQRFGHRGFLERYRKSPPTGCNVSLRDAIVMCHPKFQDKDSLLVMDVLRGPTSMKALALAQMRDALTVERLDDLVRAAEPTPQELFSRQRWLLPSPELLYKTLCNAYNEPEYVLSIAPRLASAPGYDQFVADGLAQLRLHGPIKGVSACYHALPPGAERSREALLTAWAAMVGPIPPRHDRFGAVVSRRGRRSAATLSDSLAEALYVSRGGVCLIDDVREPLVNFNVRDARAVKTALTCHVPRGGWAPDAFRRDDAFGGKGQVVFTMDHIPLDSRFWRELNVVAPRTERLVEVLGDGELPDGPLWGLRISGVSGLHRFQQHRFLYDTVPEDLLFLPKGAFLA